MSEFLKQTTKNLKLFLFPKRCPYCYCVINKAEHVCKECEKEISVYGVFQGVSGHRCCSPLIYKDRFKAAILRFKFKNKTQLAEPFAQLMYTQIQKNYEDFIFDCITYVPMHKKAQKKRGYNQTELLAKELSKLMNIPYECTLVKIKNTKPQHKLDAVKRKTNLKGAFKIKDKKLINGKNILIVDDIVTTGATLSECIKTLEKGKPAHICCVTVLSTANLY